MSLYRMQANTGQVTRVSARQYEEFVRAAFAIQASIEGSINTLLIERSRDAGERGTTRAVGPSHNGSSSLWAS